MECDSRFSILPFMKIGVIGIGWLGLPLVKALLNQGHEVIGTNRSGYTELRHSRFELIRFDPEAGKNMDLLQLGTCDLVILAFPPSRESQRAYAKDCIRITNHISTTCKVILISSTSIYPDKPGTYRETDLNTDVSRQNKIGYAEETLQTILLQRLTIIRMGGLTGPGRYPVKFMARSEKIYIGNEPVNVIHLDDAIGIILYVIDKQLWNRELNAVSTAHPSKKAFYLKMASDLHTDAPIFREAPENERSERIISNECILEAGYHFLYPDPMLFPIA